MEMGKEKGKEKLTDGSFLAESLEQNAIHLPQRIQLIREKAVSIFISNVPPGMSKNELSAMVWRAGRLVDCFIPMDSSRGSNRGFAFARFPTEKEALKAIEMISGRSWGSRKLHAQIAKNLKKGVAREERLQKKGEERREIGTSQAAGSSIEVEGRFEVHLADWVVENNKDLRNSVIGFLKSKNSSLWEVEGWLDENWGKMPVDVKRLNGVYYLDPLVFREGGR